MNTYSTIRLGHIVSMFENDSEMIIEVLSACLLQCEIMINVIARSCDEKDVATFNRVAHQIKPTMHYLGADSVYDQLNSFEADTEKQSFEYVGKETNRSLANIVVDLKLALRQIAGINTPKS
jgi:hypothetical protein